ncbi:conserved hypothetical Ustilaginaceae-specific protein [Sporisorium reilianum SRZ2]|uniref:Conserved hypothetical Ustilaginaceae-specific protein n=1 Tax=Sporisorium reilianum (strain SRZ2) TaxID=999809 RepID=E7A3B7_SPORE|nr:conserved hypothetical Ustilaginaceae-specific protein [Sporisorium reilianum SRZ2]
MKLTAFTVGFFVLVGGIVAPLVPGSFEDAVYQGLDGVQESFGHHPDLSMASSSSAYRQQWRPEHAQDIHGYPQPWSHPQPASSRDVARYDPQENVPTNRDLMRQLLTDEPESANRFIYQPLPDYEALLLKWLNKALKDTSWVKKEHSPIQLSYREEDRAAFSDLMVKNFNRRQQVQVLWIEKLKQEFILTHFQPQVQKEVREFPIPKPFLVFWENEKDDKGNALYVRAMVPMDRHLFDHLRIHGKIVDRKFQLSHQRQLPLESKNPAWLWGRGQ